MKWKAVCDIVLSAIIAGVLYAGCLDPSLAQQNVTVIGPITPGNVPQFNSNTVIKDSGIPGGAGAFANPSAAVGLTVVNGSALTAMRSDAAPPLSSSVQSALTGTSGNLLVGTGGFGFVSALLGGDCTFTSPNITCTKTNGSAFTVFATANAATATADLNLFTSTLQGLVPGSGGGTTNFLRADGTWASPIPGSVAASTVTFTQNGTGATQVTLDGIWRDHLFTPEMYGGSCGASGATNTTAIQNALNRAIVVGGQVTLQNCNYAVAGQINLTGAVSLVGTGPTGAGTILTFTPTVGGQCALNLATNPSSGILSYPVLKNFTLTTADTTTYKTGICSGDNSIITAEGLRVVGFAGGNGGVAQTILGIASSGAANEVRLNVANASTEFGNSSNEAVAVTGVTGGTNSGDINSSWRIVVVDATHIDLKGSVFTSGLTGGTVQESSQAWNSKGRELYQFKDIILTGDIGFRVSANPNAAGGIEALDESNFQNITLVGTSTNALFMVDDGAIPSSVSFSGYQSWGGGKSCFQWRDRSGVAITEQFTINNMRCEQASVSGGWDYDIQPNNAAYSINIINPLFSRTNGVRARNVPNLLVQGGNFLGTGVCVDLDTSITNFTEINNHWLATSTASLGGLTLVGTLGGKNPSTGCLPPTAAYSSLAAAAPVAPLAFDSDGRLTCTGCTGVTGQALTKADDTNVTLTLGGTPTLALLNAASITAGWTGQLAVGRGGTGIASGTSGGVPYFSGTTTIASSGALAANEIVLGGGAGAAPASLASLGTTTTVLHGNAAGAPTFGAVVGGDIATNTVANSNLVQGAAATLKGNPTVALANEQDFTIQGLTARGPPDANNDKMLLYDNAAGTLKYVTPGQVASSATAGVASLNGNTGSISFSVVRQTFCPSGCTTTIAGGASGTYTPTVGMVYAKIECLGGGGGGGSAAGSTGSIFSGAGGGSGSYTVGSASAATIGVSQTVTMGAGGAGGASGSNDGITGGSTTVGTLCVANGGGGGEFGSVAQVPLSGVGGASGTSSTSGATLAAGHPGGPGFYESGSTAITFPSGFGGSSFYGGGAKGNNGTAVNGINANLYGSGGSGAATNNTTSTAAGGNGSAGLVVITEYVIH